MFALYTRNLFLSRQWIAGLAIYSLVAFTQTASAQQYKTIKPTVTSSAAKSLGRKAKSALSDAASYQANKKAIDQYFGQYWFPVMTNYTAESLGKLAKNRETVLRAIRGSKIPAAQKQLTELASSKMSVIAVGNFHPAVRYNAVLLLGALDEKQGTNSASPVPLPAATQTLIGIVENDSVKDVKIPSSLKVGALVGLERHAHCGIAQEYAEKLTQIALKLIAQEEPPADTTLDVHHWMKHQAARVLTRQHKDKVVPQVHDALFKMISDNKLSLEDRCAVASLLPRLNYKDAEGIDGAAAVTAIGNLMKQVAQDEAQRARKYEKLKLRPDRSNVRRGEVAATYQRSRLYSRLLSIGQGGLSLKEGVPEAGKEQIANLLSPLTPVMLAAANKSSVDLEITQAVQKLEKEIVAVVDSWKKSES